MSIITIHQCIVFSAALDVRYELFVLVGTRSVSWVQMASASSSSLGYVWRLYNLSVGWGGSVKLSGKSFHQS